jgi:hypothetical protein
MRNRAAREGLLKTSCRVKNGESSCDRVRRNGRGETGKEEKDLQAMKNNSFTV